MSVAATTAAKSDFKAAEGKVERGAKTISNKTALTLWCHARFELSKTGFWMSKEVYALDHRLGEEFETPPVYPDWELTFSFAHNVVPHKKVLLVQLHRTTKTLAV